MQVATALARLDYDKNEILINWLTLSLLVWSAEIFANNFDPDQARQNVGSDLDPNKQDTLMVLLKEFFEKVDLLILKNSADKKKTLIFTH